MVVGYFCLEITRVGCPDLEVLRIVELWRYSVISLTFPNCKLILSSLFHKQTSNKMQWYMQ